MLPHSVVNLTDQHASMEKRFKETEAYAKATTIDYTDGGRNADDRKMLQS